jgi:adenine-specific DNA-methyltransferase
MENRELNLGDTERSKTTKGASGVIRGNQIYRTEGIRYAGSKRTLIPFIHEVIKPLKAKKLLDGFSGSTRVSQFFKKAGYSVHANDIANYSSVFAETYILNNEPDDGALREKIRHLNSLRGIDGFYAHAYGGADDGEGNVIATDGKKKPFLLKNARRIDVIRPEIDKIANNSREKAILLTSLILALDKVENTLGHQVAYLSRWASRAYADIILELPALLQGPGEYAFSRQDVATLNQDFDLAYLDPPYNTNNPVTVTTRVRYGSYYHFWTTLVKDDRPELVGASNRRLDLSSDRIPGVITPYENTKLEVVLAEFRRLLSGLSAKYILLSYSNKGKVPIEDFLTLMREFGDVSVTQIDHKEHVQKSLTINKQWLGDGRQNFEYLFLIKRR